MSCWDMTIFRFFFWMAGVRHLGFVVCMFGPPTTSIWWYLSMCKIWLESMQYSFNNMQVLIFNVFGLKMPIHTPNRSSFFLGGGDLPPPWGAVTSRPPPQKRHLLVQKYVIRCIDCWDWFIRFFAHLSLLPNLPKSYVLQLARHSPKSAFAPPTDRPADRQCYLWQ